MGKDTNIQWCDSTINPTMGCDGCELWNKATGKKICYAGKLHDMRGGKTKGFSPTFEVVTKWPGRLAAAAKWSDLTGTDRNGKPWLNGLPRLIFVSDMSDALSESVDFKYLRDEVVAAALSEEGRRHHYLWLTKRPKAMAEFSKWLEDKGGWPANIWAGTSITSTATAGRIAPLLDVGDESTKHFVSLEPQFERIKGLAKWLPKLDLLIQGGESGSKSKVATFDIAWARELIELCSKPGMPAYFLKQLGRRPIENGQDLRLKDGHGGNWDEWPDDLKVRQLPIAPSISLSELVHSSIPEKVEGAVPDSDRKRRRHEAALNAWATRRRNSQATETRPPPQA